MEPGVTALDPSQVYLVPITPHLLPNHYLEIDDDYHIICTDPSMYAIAQHAFMDLHGGMPNRIASYC